MTDYIELGKRLVACKGFRWMPGMLTTSGFRLLGADSRVIVAHSFGSVAEGGGWLKDRPGGLCPDLSDAATRGCLMQLVREVWQDPTVHIGVGCFGWVILNAKNPTADMVHHAANFEIEEEAMVVAIEAAP